MMTIRRCIVDHPTLFHSTLKTFLSLNPAHRCLLCFFLTDSTDSPDCLSMDAYPFLVFIFSCFHFLVFLFCVVD